MCGRTVALCQPTVVLNTLGAEPGDEEKDVVWFALNEDRPDLRRASKLRPARTGPRPGSRCHRTPGRPHGRARHSHLLGKPNGFLGPMSTARSHHRRRSAGRRQCGNREDGEIGDQFGMFLTPLVCWREDRAAAPKCSAEEGRLAGGIGIRRDNGRGLPMYRHRLS